MKILGETVLGIPRFSKLSALKFLFYSALGIARESLVESFTFVYTTDSVLCFLETFSTNLPTS